MDLRAVVLLDSSKGETILEAFRAGARGVFSKNDSVDTLSKCIRRVYEGQIWANTEQVATLVQALASSHNIRAVDARGLNLLSNGRWKSFGALPGTIESRNRRAITPKPA